MLAGIHCPKMVEIRENPGRPYMGPILLLEQCDMFIRFQNKANISYPVGRPGRHKDQPKDPHTRAKIIK